MEKRKLLRAISEYGLRIVLKGLSRKQRRALGRVYCSVAYRKLHGLRDYVDDRINDDLVSWIVKEARANVG